MAGTRTELAPGLLHHPGYLDGAAQARLAAEIRGALHASPPYVPTMPGSGRPFSVRMTNCGGLGWVSDRNGYRYQPTHPQTGDAWPSIPACALAGWWELSGFQAPPEACLVNLYGPSARMGLHQDRDEQDLSAPVVSLSLGASALFRYGGTKRSDPTRSVRLHSGDALVIGGASRLIFHGIDRLMGPEPDLLAREGAGLGSDFLGGFLPQGGRCNLTLRRVTRPGA